MTTNHQPCWVVVHLSAFLNSYTDDLNWRLEPDVFQSLMRLKGIPVILITHLSAAATEKLLASASLKRNFFERIIFNQPGTMASASWLPSLAIPDHGWPERCFVLGSTVDEMRLASALIPTFAAQGCELVLLALRRDMSLVLALEAQGARFVAASLLEAAELIIQAAPVGPKGTAVVSSERRIAMSFILMAYNEEATITKTIEEVRYFAALYCQDYEIIVVDDGSTDATGANAQMDNRGDLSMIRHATNLGMGATMRDSYQAARKDYVVPLPADRQVRVHSLIHFLPHVASDHVVTSNYILPHGSAMRRLMSATFRCCLRWIGGFKVDFAGAYIFPRQLLQRVDFAKAASNSFVFSFELLEQFLAMGCRFEQVWIHPYLRDVGVSRVATLSRILKVFQEIVISRWRRLRY